MKHFFGFLFLFVLISVSGFLDAQKANIITSISGEEVKIFGIPYAILYNQSGTVKTVGYAS